MPSQKICLTVLSFLLNDVHEILISLGQATPLHLTPLVGMSIALQLSITPALMQKRKTITCLA